MPVWTCNKCGQKVESFSFDEKPWNDHACSDTGKEVELAVPEMGKDPLPPREKKQNLMDFF